MIAALVTGCIMGIFLFAPCNSAVVQHKNIFDYNDETNSAVLQYVSDDTDDDELWRSNIVTEVETEDTDDENIAQYHEVRDDAELWIVEDFDKVMKVSKVRYANGEYKCLVESLDKSNSTQSPEIGAPAAANRTSIPIEDSSFLGKTASTLCADTPVYRIFETSDNVATTDLPAGKISRRKRSSSCNLCCNGLEYCYVDSSWIGPDRCTKRCEGRLSFLNYDTYNDVYYHHRMKYYGCMLKDYVPARCGGTGRYA